MKISQSRAAVARRLPLPEVVSAILTSATKLHTRRWYLRKNKTKNAVGRPRAIGEKELQKLKEAFLMGCTNREACLYADVAESTFYDFLKEYPEYSEKIDIWKNYEKIKARMVVHNALNKGDRDMAKWYLERKAKDEFSTKQEVDATVNNRVVIVDDLPDEE